MNPGEPFNPYKMFTGIFIPEALVRWPYLSAGAKLCYGRLARYAGEDGGCFPSQTSIAEELGTSERNVRNYLGELKATALIRARHRYRAKGSRTSDQYDFLWHELFEAANRKDSSGMDGAYRNDSSGSNRKDSSGEDSQYLSESSSSAKESPSSGVPEISETPRKPAEPKTPETPSEPLRVDDDETLEPPERLRRWIERTHPRPAGDPEERTAADIVGLVTQDLNERGRELDAGFIAFVRSRATGKARNRAGLYRKLAKDYAKALGAAALQKHVEFSQAIKHGVKDDFNPGEKHPCCGGNGKTASGEFCSCDCGKLMRQVEERAAKRAAEGKAA